MKPGRSDKLRRFSRPTFSLRSHLIALVILALLPLLLFSAWLIAEESKAERSATEERLLDNAKVLAADVDREVISAINTLQTLALSYDLDRRSSDEFRQLSDRMLSSQENWQMVVLEDPAGKQLASMTRASDDTAPDSALTSEERIKDLQTKEGQVIDSPLASVVGRSVGILVPVRRQEKIQYITSGLMKPEVFAHILSQHQLPKEWLGAILDARQIVVASTRSAEKFFGKPTQLLVDEANQPGQGRWFRTMVENVPSYVLFANAPLSGWSVTLAVPIAAVEAPLHQKVWFINGAGMIAAVFGALLAALVARRMARPIELLAMEAQQRAAGRSSAGFTRAAIAEANALADAFDESAHLLKQREAERDSVQDQLKVQLDDLTRLHELSTNLVTIEDQQALLSEIVTGALILLKTDQGNLQLLNPDSKRLEVVGRIGYTNEVIELVQGALSEQGVSGTALARRRSVLVDDIENSPILDGKQRSTASEAGIGAVYSIPLLGGQGEVVGVLTTYFASPWRPSEWEERLIKFYTQYCANIVEQWRAKERLRTLSDQLEKRVIERTAELKKTNDQLLGELAKKPVLENPLRQAQKMETIGTLAGGVAHDFNNILNIILGYASLLEQNREPQAVADAASTIKEMAQRGASLVRQLLAVAQKTEPKFEITDPNRLVKNATELLAQTFPKNIDVDVELDPKVRSMPLDPNQITQAIINLCVNARDAMPNGGRLLIKTESLSASQAKQRFMDAENTPYLCVTVSDTGSGIPKRAEEHIFEPFFTTKGPSRGTGLGLAVVYGIVRSHNGLIHFTSEPNHGTSLYVCLPTKPLALEARRQPEEPAKKSVQPAAHTTVLIVEDEQPELRLLRAVFEKEGYRVLTSTDGTSAIETFAAHKEEVAVVLLDFGLPKANGWEVFQRLKIIDPTVKVIFATGNLPSEIDAETLKAESCGVIMKPYVPVEALTKVAEVVA